MSFLAQRAEGTPNAGAVVCLEHVGLREFRRAVLGNTALLQLELVEIDACEIRYEYAVFRDDESCIFNARPDDAGAKPVTVAYFGARPDQL